MSSRSTGSLPSFHSALRKAPYCMMLLFNCLSRRLSCLLRDTPIQLFCCSKSFVRSHEHKGGHSSTQTASAPHVDGLPALFRTTASWLSQQRLLWKSEPRTIAGQSWRTQLYSFHLRRRMHRLPQFTTHWMG